MLTYTDEIRDDGVTCGGAWTLDEGFLWHDCVYQAQDISPSGDYVVAAPSQYDGLGYKEISILDARTGVPAASYQAEDEAEFISSGVAWTTANNLLFASYDGAEWHLNSMSPDGTVTELVDPVAGEDVDNPWVLIRH